MWHVLCVFPLRGQVVLQTRLPQTHERRAVPLDGAGLSDGCGDSCDADLYHSLIIVVGQIVLFASSNMQNKAQNDEPRTKHVIHAQQNK